MVQLISEREKLISSFSNANLIAALSEDQHQLIESKCQVIFLFEYLTELECKYIVIEKNYTDKYFLDDYLHFYGSCHKNYPRICRRLHFFKGDPKNLEVVLENENFDHRLLKDLQQNYLGFVVAKPISNVVIGRTVLKPYSQTKTEGFTDFDEIEKDKKPKRYFETLRKYNANLFGIPLELKSLAFQEQDNVISACATTALWVVLEKICYEYEYYTPTPYEITIKAHEHFATTRAIPSSGLTFGQIIDVIRDIGLDQEIIDFGSYPGEQILPLCYAYLKAGFPVFMGVQIGD